MSPGGAGWVVVALGMSLAGVQGGAGTAVGLSGLVGLGLLSVFPLGPAWRMRWRWMEGMGLAGLATAALLGLAIDASQGLRAHAGQGA